MTVAVLEDFAYVRKRRFATDLMAKRLVALRLATGARKSRMPFISKSHDQTEV